MSKEKKVKTTAEQDYTTNKILSAFTIAFVLIIGVMYFSRMMHRIDTFVAAMKSVKTLTIILAAVTLLFAVLAVIAKLRGKDKVKRLLSPKHLAVVFGFATLCFGALTYSFAENTISFLYVLISAVTVLFIVYNIYPRDFFANALIIAFGAFGVWLTGTAISGGMGASKFWLIVGATMAGLAILVTATIVVHANGGKFCRKAKRCFLPENAKYGLMYLSFAIIALLLVATWFMVGALTYYFLFGLLAYFIVVGIYYSLKMI